MSTMGDQELKTSSRKDGDDNKHKGENGSREKATTDKRPLLVMRRELGLTTSVALIIGTIIGSGIFISPTGVLKYTGSVGLSLTIWVVGGLIAALGSICYVELGTVIQKSGGDYAILRDGFGSASPRLGEILGFLYIFVNVFVSQPVGRALYGLVFVQYMVKPFFLDNCDDEVDFKPKLLAIVVVCVVTAINYYSVRVTARLHTVFSSGKILALVIIVVGGIVNVSKGHTEILSTGFEGSKVNAGSIALALYHSMFAYSGWQVLNGVIEEVKNPAVTYPLAVGIALPLVTILYILCNVSYLTVLSTDEMLATDVVAVSWGHKTSHGLIYAMPIFVASSVFGATLAGMMVNSRFTTVASRDGVLFQLLSFVHVDRLIPGPSIMLAGFLTILMLFISDDVSKLVELLGFIDATVLSLAMVALLILRRTRPDAPRPIKVSIVFPILFLLCSVFLIAAPIVGDPSWDTLYGVLVVLSGLLFYIPFIYFKLSLPFMNRITLWTQVLLKVAPSEQPLPVD